MDVGGLVERARAGAVCESDQSANAEPLRHGQRQSGDVCGFGWAPVRTIGSSDRNGCPTPSNTKTGKKGEGRTGDGTKKSHSQIAQKIADEYKKIAQDARNAARAVGNARAAEQTWLKQHPNIEALIMIGAMVEGGGDPIEGEGEGGEGVGEFAEPTSPNQMNQQVVRGQAPDSVDRVDVPRTPYEKPHIEFKDGNALNNDGTWKHGGRPLTNVEIDWIIENGWKLPTK